MQINLVENIGSGHSGPLNINDGMSIADLFRQRHGEQKPASFAIRVNSARAESAYMLEAGDSVTFSPIKVEGGN
jgi:hypothetical protein